MSGVRDIALLCSVNRIRSNCAYFRGFTMLTCFRDLVLSTNTCDFYRQDMVWITSGCCVQYPDTVSIKRELGGSTGGQDEAAAYPTARSVVTPSRRRHFL